METSHANFSRSRHGVLESILANCSDPSDHGEFSMGFHDGMNPRSQCIRISRKRQTQPNSGSTRPTGPCDYVRQAKLEIKLFIVYHSMPGGPCMIA